MDILLASLKHSLMITVFVFVMLMLMDYLNVLTRGGKIGSGVREEPHPILHYGHNRR